MADETTATAPVTDTNLEETAASTTETKAAPAEATDGVTDTKESADAANANGDTKESNTAANGDVADVAENTAEDAAEVTEDAVADAQAGANGTDDTKKDNKKRKSSAGVPEHKGKKLNKKKSTLNLQLSAEPGEVWWARMKGHPPWPAVICDEEMLPESLLSKRPVSAARVDGTFREDFNEGGKNARDRRYPIMFLGTNEFAWHVNTDLAPLDLDKIKTTVAKGERGKMSKHLWEAYEVAEQEHDLAWFKTMLAEHEAAMRADAEEREQKDAEKAAKKEKKEKRKSKSAADEDVEMEDADDAEAKKSKSKKRKKEADEEDADEKPTKTPKTKLKVNGPKTPADSASKPKSAKKAKKPAKASEDEAAVEEEEAPMTEAEKHDKRKKTVLYLRHRLQKGFLARDGPPKEEEMQQMAGHFAQLEQYVDLEADIIKETKIHKVLKAIVKLEAIPKEEEYNFRKRSTELLNVWTKTIASEIGTPTTAEATEAKTNGVSHDAEDKAEGGEEAAREDAPAEKEANKDEAPATEDKEDVPMIDAKDDAPATKESENAEEPEKTAAEKEEKDTAELTVN